MRVTKRVRVLLVRLQLLLLLLLLWLLLVLSLFEVPNVQEPCETLLNIRHPTHHVPGADKDFKSSP